jgi:hypothetical protein
MNMTEQQMLELVRSLMRANRWEVDQYHGQSRMQQRSVTFADVEHALLHATQCRLQENGRWKLVSCDLDGDDLTLIVVVDDEVLVITLF